LQADLKSELNEEACMSTLCNACSELEQSQKKTLIASEQDRPDVALKRVQWRSSQGMIDPAKVVFIDEREPKPT
jgi:hypothetical protein